MAMAEIYDTGSRTPAMIIFAHVYSVMQLQAVRQPLLISLFPFLPVSHVPGYTWPYLLQNRLNRNVPPILTSGGCYSVTERVYCDRHIDQRLYHQRKTKSQCQECTKCIRTFSEYTDTQEQNVGILQRMKAPTNPYLTIMIARWKSEYGCSKEQLFRCCPVPFSLCDSTRNTLNFDLVYLVIIIFITFLVV